MQNNKPPILIVAGAGFLRAYAGTLYLARALHELGHPIKVIVPSNEKESLDYAELDIPVSCMMIGGNRVIRRLRSFLVRWRVFREILFSKRVIVTENTFLLEAATARLLRGRALKLGHFSQELHLSEEMPDLPRARLNARLARVPDFTIDVEPNRAKVRQQKLMLRDEPLVLCNTLHLSGIPSRGAQGGLERLAGESLPHDIPILLHMGGVGREKPLERVIDAVASCPEPVFFLAFCNAPSGKLSALQNYAAKVLKKGAYQLVGPQKRDELLASAWEADLGVIDYSTSVENTSNQRHCAPTKLYEFMALGLAVVGSNNESLRGVIEISQVGYCAVGESAQELGAAIQRTISDENELRQMKLRAAVAFRDKYCYEQVCVDVVQIISQKLA